MALEIVETIRASLASGAGLRQSDVLALCATCEHLWRQHVVSPQQARQTGQSRREYMRAYMRAYRARKRLVSQGNQA